MFRPIKAAAQTVTAVTSAAIAASLSAFPAFAAQPTPWQIWHQPAASPGMEAIIAFDWWTLYFLVPITLFVMALLAYVMIRFREKANPVPSTTTHNTTIEVVWTLAPVAILVAIAIPSFQLLSSQFNPPKPPSVTVKATGYQWYWGFEYQDESEISFETRPIGAEAVVGVEQAAAERADSGKTDLSKYPNLLAVDNEMVVPVGEVIRVLVTAGDVIHNFAMPAFGLKMDGYPGRINEVFFQPTKEGLYYGQCSELCGKFHAYMPIAIRVVSMEDYEAWKTAAVDDVDAANKALRASIYEREKLVRVANTDSAAPKNITE
ncbi:MAG: cytochrome c oxidase subunit II [Pseudomonadota bacterium]